MASPLRNGEQAAAERRKVAGRMGALLLLLRAAALCFSLAAAVFARRRTAPLRFLLAANAIVAVYSAFEVAAASWEVAKGATLLPEAMQLWFDFGHDQGFGSWRWPRRRRRRGKRRRAAEEHQQRGVPAGRHRRGARVRGVRVPGAGRARDGVPALVRFLATGSRLPGSSSAPSSTSPY